MTVGHLNVVSSSIATGHNMVALTNLGRLLKLTSVETYFNSGTGMFVLPSSSGNGKDNSHYKSWLVVMSHISRLLSHSYV